MQLRYFLLHQDTVVVVEKKVKPPVNVFRGTVLRDVNTKKNWHQEIDSIPVS